MTLRYVVSDGTHQLECSNPLEALGAAGELFPGLIVSIYPADTAPKVCVTCGLALGDGWPHLNDDGEEIHERCCVPCREAS